MSLLITEHKHFFQKQTELDKMKFTFKKIFSNNLTKNRKFFIWKYDVIFLTPVAGLIKTLRFVFKCQ